MGGASHAFNEAQHPRGFHGKFAAIESDIRKAAAREAKKTNGWVMLADVRKHLRGHSREDVDSTLVQMSRHPDIDISPESNQKALSAEQHAAAVMIGNQRNHIIRVTGKSPAPAASAPMPSAPVRKAGEVMKAAKKTPAKPASGVDAEIKAARTRAALTALASRYDIKVTALHSEKHIRDMIRAAAAKG